MKRTALIAALSAATFAAHAATPDTTDEVVVTATRFSQPLAQTLSSTTVITRQDIQDSQAADLPTILRDVPGVEFSQNGGVGKTASLYLRGSNSTHVPVLLDGVRINSATTGTTSIQDLMLDQIERIEVVRGNVSSLYGSEAIGGVVQIFTKRGRGKPAFNVSGGAGSLGTKRFSAGFGGTVEATSFHAQLSGYKTDGVSAINQALAPNANPDRDGYRNTSLSANVRHAFNTDHGVSATLFTSFGNNQYDNAFGLPTDVNANDSRLSMYSVVADDRLSEGWDSQLKLAQGVDDYQDIKNGLPTAGGHYRTTNRQLTWQNTVQVGSDSQLVLGAEHLAQYIASDKVYVRTERTINSLFAGYTGNFDPHQVQLNVREDRNSQFGSPATGLLGYGFALSDAWRATASYSTAFKAPTFNELYYPAFGNVALQPERSRNAEAGVHYAAGHRRLDAVYFDNRIRDLIVYAPLPVNVAEARIDGVEVSGAARVGETAIKAALTSQNPRDVATGQQLVRRARLHSSVSLSRRFGDWLLGGEWLHSGTREDNHITAYPPQRVILPAYDVFNLTASYAIGKAWRFSLRADNLTNRDDSDAHGYNPLGRTFFVSINYQS